jgi:hypothetical protein
MITEYWIQTDGEGYGRGPIWATIPVFPAETEENQEKLGKIASFRASH